ncbi:MAG: metal ABC transporter ATP-binding protein [Ruminococcus sp.]|nr:metal ABC transporter ATP-binding protein [Oscillospiraceae bacterium]MDY4413075.1 metal ABC transporter ATP-binding protein [Ruminococcus sp.]
MSKTLISCKSISASYDGMNVLRDLTFSVNEGDYLCIVGENGSGKSTLIKCLLGIKQVDSGEIIMGEGLKQTDIGYLPQQTVLQKGFPATVGEVVLSGCLNSRGYHPFFTSKEKKRASESMEKLGISDLKSRSYRELSGGQQQRVLLARALCSAKKMILLDEPVTALDPLASSELYSVISELNQKYNIAVIMVSHDIENSVGNASHVLHLRKNGYFFGTSSEYSDSESESKFI